MLLCEACTSLNPTAVAVQVKQPNKTTEYTLEEKRSRFITEILPCSDETEIKQRIAELKALHPKASHVCSAFRIFANEQIKEGFSDDGEPSGTAGMPMLKTLRHKDLINCATLITRYFGGTKLGTGGLQRAYSQATSDAIQTLTENDFSELIARSELCIHCSFSRENELRHILLQNSASILSSEYEWDGVRTTFSVNRDQVRQIKSMLENHNFQPIDKTEK